MLALPSPVASPPIEAPSTPAPAIETPAVQVGPVVTPPAIVPGDYFVAVALFATQERADRLVKALAQAGFPAVQRPLQLRTQLLQQVVLGPFVHRADAVADLQRLRKLGGYDDANVIDTALAPSVP
jgi:cell division septation protein DedD